MLGNLLSKAFGSANDRAIRKHYKIVQKINELEKDLSQLSDEGLKARTPWLKERLNKGESLDDILPDAFATVREASVRVFGMRPFDVQLIGGIILHKGMIAEMKTGEGKTLMATLPIYLNALAGKGVHLVTVNDYLVKRDSQWMGQLYNFLGLSVGCIVHGITDAQRQEAYNADITYATNHELGFDYLRDNMKFRLKDMVQRPFYYAIVDEVDSILIDEARTPLIISGPAEDSSQTYMQVNKIIPMLDPSDYEKDEKQRSVIFTESGTEKIERLLEQAGLLTGTMLYDVHNISLVHHVNQALRAHTLFNRDVDYIVKDNKIMIIDEFTGRIMDGRRYSEGLHQALEAKENVKIEQENQTLASITYQNYFRLYSKLAGMTGTALTEASEFDEIYKLQCVSVPTNKPVARKDYEDEVYLTADEKYDAVVTLIQECRDRKQPVLVGTTSIEKSELISKILEKKKIPHHVLNARYHEQESMIIADAGCPGAVTIATNMAGRGTDIKLGGNLEARIAKELAQSASGELQEKRIATIREEIARDEEVVKQAGGLYVIGTERHESRRIDNQLRGRSGRQGDPGASKFFISLQDDLMRIFGSERLDSMLRKLGVEQGEAISHSWVSKALERAQQKVEARNFEIRKHLLRYDDVMNDQRKIIYEQRRELMASDNIQDMIVQMREQVVDSLVDLYVPENTVAEQFNIDTLHAQSIRLFNIDWPLTQWILDEGISPILLKQRMNEEITKLYTNKESKYGESIMRSAERTLLLRLLDHTWKEHLLSLDQLRQGINLRAYAQNNPLNEYKREAFELFGSMMQTMREEIIQTLMHFEMEVPDESALNSLLDDQTDYSLLQENSSMDSAPSNESEELTPEQVQELINMMNEKYPRNAQCPCGSGKKFKHCHGALQPD